MSDAIWKLAQSVGFDDYELKPMLEAFASALSQAGQGGQGEVVATVRIKYDPESGEWLGTDDAAQPAPVESAAAEIARLTACLKAANDNHEHFERLYYLKCDELEAAQQPAPAVPADLPSDMTDLADIAQVWACNPKLREFAATMQPKPVAPAVPAAPVDVPLGAIENGREHARRLVDHYGFTDLADHKLQMCSDWVEFVRCFEHLADYVLSAAPKPARKDV